MHIRPALAIGLGMFALIGAGCSQRDDVVVDELQAENERLTNRLEELHGQAQTLETQRNAAREELARYREQNQGLQEQIRRIEVGSGSGASFTTGLLAETADGGVALDGIAFSRGSADLTDEGVAAIRELAAILNNNENGDFNVFVVGHTDSTPVVRAATREKFGNNWGLSAMRASSVLTALEEAGVSSARLRGAFRGQHAPVAGGNSSEAKAANRRVEVRLSL